MTGCGVSREVVVLPGDRLVQAIPGGHCIECHADYYDNRVTMDKSYLLEIFKMLEGCGK